MNRNGTITFAIAIGLCLGLSACGKASSRGKINKNLTGSEKEKNTGGQSLNSLVGKDCLRIDRLSSLLTGATQNIVTVHMSDLDIGELSDDRVPEYTSAASVNEKLDYFFKKSERLTLINYLGPQMLKHSQIGPVVDVTELDEKCESGKFHGSGASKKSRDFTVINKGTRFLVVQLDNSDGEVRSYSLNMDDSVSIHIYRPLHEKQLCGRTVENLVVKTSYNLAINSNGQNLKIHDSLTEMLTTAFDVPASVKLSSLDISDYMFFSDSLQMGYHKEIKCE